MVLLHKKNTRHQIWDQVVTPALVQWCGSNFIALLSPGRSVYTGLLVLPGVLATACFPGNGHLLPRERVGEQDAPSPQHTTDAAPLSHTPPPPAPAGAHFWQNAARMAKAPQETALAGKLPFAVEHHLGPGLSLSRTSNQVPH